MIWATHRRRPGTSEVGRARARFRAPIQVALLALLACGPTMTAVAATAKAQATSSSCPPSYDFTTALDYLDPSERVQTRIRGFETNHLNSNVENLIRGQSTAAVAGDLKFILNLVPNHHRALQALMRLSVRDKTDNPPESEPYSSRCWMHRATVFNPKDGRSFLILGIYTARLGEHQEALTWLEQADRLLGDDLNVNYNLGLVYFELGNYALSLERAKRAYAAGFPLPGLRQKLVRAGQWKE